MTNDEFNRELRHQRRREKRGTDTPRCGVCGNDDDRVHESHHVAGRKHDDSIVTLCRNCHRIVTDDQKDHPTAVPVADPFLVTVGNFLLGLADMLDLVVERLIEFGRRLIERGAESGEAQP